MIKILIPPEKFYSNDFEKFVLKEIITYESVLINQIINTYEYKKYSIVLNFIEKLIFIFEMWIVKKIGHSQRII